MAAFVNVYRYSEIGELLRLKGCAKTKFMGFIAKMAGCISSDSGPLNFVYDGHASKAYKPQSTGSKRSIADGYWRPPDHKRTLQSKSWRAGITAISPSVLFHKTNASPTSTIVPPFLGPPWLARPGHLHPFVHRLTKGPHTYIDHLICCAPLLVALNLSVTRFPTLCVVTYMVYHPTAAMSARETSKTLSLDAAFTV
ncbi:uncharacterized protein LACBIDRAFT_329113 [Laccaria bicolor S238N-H82]|uniref:Predicted protein n=1 Tax=Laccaria bicolor (strain S238N-H82 / ATCC MYA-4686) TaxID=486041 RepID=B0DH45_LACBS|nr:uncharacterized protein LACBIDRAFT_329113 [Laccaria bicolor S238N-H82]EDR06048.1 predicted protein [Laccaria bicolor S238N-H82]|eukprot:XP_001883336.1 predicted protein [Laccaria bicolor S238N-H82]